MKGYFSGIIKTFNDSIIASMLFSEVVDCNPFYKLLNSMTFV